MTKALIIMAAVFQTVLMASSAYASDGTREATCDVNSGDNSLLKCYQSEYKRKLHDNDVRSKDLVSRAKEQLQDANEAEAHHHADAYVDLIRKVNQTVVSTRKTAAQECVRMAARFRSQSTSVVAAINCRSGHEVQLDKQLRRYELQLEVLSIDPQ
jgi:hypothetical protein